jgi:hypothetical protein
MRFTPRGRLIMATFSTLTTGSLLLLGTANSPADAASSAASSAATTAAKHQSSAQSTSFALRASGFGTALHGGQVPAGSDRTALASIGCTNKAGVSTGNHEAAATVPGLGTLSGVTTKLWTERDGGTVGSFARHSIASVQIADSPLGSLELNGVTSFSEAFHDAGGFHARTTIDVASATLTTPDGQSQQLAVPTPGQPLVVPGLAEVAIGNSDTRRTATAAVAKAQAIRVHVIPTDTTSRIAHAAAGIAAGIKSGRFAGVSSGTDLKAIDDHVTSGRTPVLYMPCQGTHGDVRTASLAHADLGHNVIARGLNARQWSKQTADRAEGVEQGSIARVSLGGGKVVITGIVARAHVVREGGKVLRSPVGSQIAKVLVNGELRRFPSSDTIVVPGVAKLERRIVDRTSNGIKVTALRLTVLDGTGAVLNLGRASMAIRSAG